MMSVCTNLTSVPNSLLYSLSQTAKLQLYKANFVESVWSSDLKLMAARGCDWTLSLSLLFLPIYDLRANLANHVTNLLRNKTRLVTAELQTLTKMVAFKFLLRSPLATTYIYMLWFKNEHVMSFFPIVLWSHLLLCSCIKLRRCATWTNCNR